MLDAIKPLLDSDLVNEETRSAIAEQWEAKMNETRTQVTAELREEFAQRYEHDKSTMVEALDRMVTEGLTSELEQIAEERKAITEDRAKFVAKMQEASGTFDQFLVKTLSEEIKELKSERAEQQALVGKLEEFVTSQLSEEISDFQKDRQDVVETKVRLVKEAREQFTNLKEKFVKHTSQAVNEAVTGYLKGEMNQLKEDIQIARENNFGRKIFETFAGEFSTTYLNDKAETRKIVSVLNDKEQIVNSNTSIILAGKCNVDIFRQQDKIIYQSATTTVCKANVLTGNSSTNKIYSISGLNSITITALGSSNPDKYQKSEFCLKSKLTS